jgi:methionyl-tRNA formyltransferase
VAKRRLRVVVVAEEAAGVQVVQGLSQLETKPEVVAVLTRSREQGAERPVVFEAAQRLGFEVWPSSSVRSPELGAQLASADVDLLVNVHSLYLIHPAVLSAPKIGSFNLHPGVLPEYAGLNIPSWAIYRGESQHGVTLHWMDEGIDTGPIAWQERFPIEPEDTGLSLSGKSVRSGVPLILELAGTAADDPGAIPRHAQALERREYFAAGPPADGRVDWAQPAEAILRFVRACDYGPYRSPWGVPQAELAGRKVGVTKATATRVTTEDRPGTVVELDPSGALVATGDQLILVQRLSLDGRSVKPIEALEELG